VLRGEGLGQHPHTCATLPFAQDVDPHTIMDTLVYSQISLTMNAYAQMIPALQRESGSKMGHILRTAPPALSGGA
jgi:hypothetical protein